MRWLYVLALASWGCADPTPRGAPPDARFEIVEDEWDTSPRDAAFEPPRDVAPSCVALEAPGDPVTTGAPIQAWCAEEATNPPSCPGAAPTGGDACTSEGLLCRYARDALGATLARCKAGKWSLDSIACASECPAYTGGTFALAACGSSEDLPCATNDQLTDFTRASLRLRAIADCCGGLNENALSAQLTDGCVTSIAIASPRPENAAFATCLGKLLGGRRLACAKGGCLEVGWSTVK